MDLPNYNVNPSKVILYREHLDINDLIEIIKQEQYKILVNIKSKNNDSKLIEIINRQINLGNFKNT